MKRKYISNVGYSVLALSMAAASTSIAADGDAVKVDTNATVTNSTGATSSLCYVDSATKSVVCGDKTTVTDAKNAIVIGSGATVKLDNSASIGNGATATDVHDTKKGGTYTYSGTNDGNVAGVDDVTGVVSVGNNDQTRQVQNVAAGVITEDSTDAVNASQLYYTNTAIANNSAQISSNTSGIRYNTTNIRKNTQNITNINNTLGKGLSVKGDNGESVNYQLGETIHILGGDNVTTSTTDNSLLVTLNKNITVDSVQAGNTLVNNDGVSIQNSTVSLTSQGLNNGGNVISNVAPGVADTDAVNVSQLNALNRKLSNQIQEVEDIANAGTASAIAASHIPQPYQAGASMFGLGAGTYGGQSAISLGLSAISDNGVWILKGSATYDTQNKAGVGVGIGYQW